MIIDVHGHVSAPPTLYAYKSFLLASRGAHGKWSSKVTDEDLRESAEGHIELLRSVGTDVQLLSPRPFQLMHSEEPSEIVEWWVAENNDTIKKTCDMFPDVFKGVCGLPQRPGVSPANCVAELERCVEELGFVGCLLNSDPGEGDQSTPPLGDEFWYPLYEKLVELDVPALLHTAGCRNPRLNYSLNFINEESIAVMSLLSSGSKVFDDFPGLKLVIPHGGGAVPYQMGRWKARAYAMGDTPFEETIRQLYFDTTLYTKDAIELLIKNVGSDRVLFGTEKPGSGSAQDPETGAWLDDLKPVVESIEWLDEKDRQAIFEENARRLYRLDER